MPLLNFEITFRHALYVATKNNTKHVHMSISNHFVLMLALDFRVVHNKHDIFCLPLFHITESTV